MGSLEVELVCPYQKLVRNVQQGKDRIGIWELASASIEAIQARMPAVSEYGFAIPNEEAIEALSKCEMPMIEHGAGLAYWASLARQRHGVEIDCFDCVKYPDTTAYKFAREPWYPVTVGRTQDMIQRKPYQTLILIWPCYAKPEVFEVLQQFQGSTVFYVGESDGGCTGDDAFHELLRSKFEISEEIAIPQWWGLHDRLEIWKRM